MGIGGRHGRQVDVRVSPGKTRRDNPDDGIERVIQLNGFAQHVAIAAELPLPEQIAENRAGCRITVGSVRRRELATEKRWNAHVSEEIG